MTESIQDKISSSTRWTLLTEIMAKLIAPVSNIILARLLAPDAFGVLASVQMVVSFADMLADAGFQKYIVQKEFEDEQEKDNCTIVAIWSNIILAVVLWLIIIVWRDNLASLVGNPGLGFVLAVAGIAIPLTSISSVQLALLRRDFRFKNILVFRLITILVPLVVTVPLAFFGYGYWSLIIGHIAAQGLLACVVSLYSGIRFRLYYEMHILKKMVAFSAWTLIESIAIWLTSWIDMFIVSNSFSAHYLGIYRMSMVSVNSIIAMLSGAIVPVLYSALSRLQNDEQQFYDTFYHILSRSSIIIVPIGVGIFTYRDLARAILFGSKWQDADMMIGLWGLTSCLAVLFCHFCSELYRAKGAPKVSFLAQALHMSFLVPIIYCFSNSFEDLVYMRNFARLQFILVHLVLVYYFFKVNPLTMLKKVALFMVAAVVMYLAATFARSLYQSRVYDFITIAISIIVYFTTIMASCNGRKIIRTIIKNKSLY